MNFSPASLLEGPRVLALELTPLEAGPGEIVTVTPHLFVPAGMAPPALAFTFCPLSAGPRLGYACASPACETRLEVWADGTARADPTALALSCLAALGGTGTSAGGGDLPEVVEMVIALELRAA